MSAIYNLTFGIKYLLYSYDLRILLIMTRSISENARIVKEAGFITALSLVIGLAYYFYLTNVSSAHDLVRIVPLIWTIVSVVGVSRTIQAFRVRVARPAVAIILIVALSSTLFAAIFSLAALIGD